MNFKKYSSIENSYQEKYVNEIIERGHAGGEWCVNEKVHGSNFSFITDGETVSCAKRTEPLKITDRFFNFQQVLNENREKVMAIGRGVTKADTNITKVYIYGELFGGIYIHPDIKAILQQTIVQKGVYYSPRNMFYAFDIRVEFSDGSFQWYRWDEAIKLFELVEMFYAKTLFVGTLEECLKYPNQFNTNIPGWLGLPEIENNICEGVVIKPFGESKHFPNGDRIILKNKNDKWSEKASAPRVPKVKQELGDEQIEQRSAIDLFITENRLRNVLSKIGEVSNKDFPIIMKAFVQDILEDFAKEYDMNVYGREFGQYCSKAAANMIRANFIDIVNGKF